MGVTVINTNDIREEIKCRINIGNACYYSFEKTLSSHMFSKKLKVNTFRKIIRNLKSRRLRWAGHVARMWQLKNAYRDLVGKPESKRPLGRPRCRGEYNIKMDLRDVGCDPRD